MDKLHSMAVAIEIDRRGSLTAAARTMNLSLPTIVRILAELERSLGVLLFNRTTRRLSITDEGQIYLEHCRKILSDVRDAEQAMSRSQIEPAGSLTVTAPVRFGELHIAPLVVSYLLAYPKTEVKLLLLDRLVNLVEEGVDVAVRIAPLEDSALMARRAGSIRQVIVASPAFLARQGVPSHPSDLPRQSCVLASNIGELASWEFSESGKAFWVRIAGRMHCNNVGAGLAACIAGLGFGRFLQYQVADALARGQLHLVLDSFEPPPRPLSLVYAANRLGNVRVSSFVEMAIGALRAEFDRPRV